MTAGCCATKPGLSNEAHRSRPWLERLACRTRRYFSVLVVRRSRWRVTGGSLHRSITCLNIEIVGAMAKAREMKSMLALTAAFASLGALVLFLVMLWRSLAGLRSDRFDAPVDDIGPSLRDALLEEKQRILQDIEESRLDLAAGKLSDEEQAQLESELRAEARGVMQMLDAQVDPYRAEAEALAAAALQDISFANPAKKTASAGSASKTDESVAPKDARAASNGVTQGHRPAHSSSGVGEGDPGHAASLGPAPEEKA